MTEAERIVPDEGVPAVPSSMSFHYEKVDGFRTIHVDGAFGGISPRMLINMAIYAERNPLPVRVDVEVEGVVEEGEGLKLGSELYREGKTGVFRELQCNLVMDFNVAKALRDWLGTKIEELEKLRKKAQDKSND